MTKELSFKKVEDQEKFFNVKNESVRVRVSEEEILNQMNSKFKCLKGIVKNKKWYNMVMGWIVKFEEAKNENGWMWANVESYKPEMKDEREVNMKEYIYVGERRRIIEEDIIDKVNKILKPIFFDINYSQKTKNIIIYITPRENISKIELKA